MRNLYQPSSSSNSSSNINQHNHHHHHHMHYHHNSYPNEQAQFIDNQTQSILINQSSSVSSSSPKIIQFHNRNQQTNQSPSFLVNKHNFTQSPKPKTVFTVQTNSYLNTSNNDQSINQLTSTTNPVNNIKSPNFSINKLIKPHKLSSSSSLSSTSSISLLNSSSSNNQTDLYAINSLDTTNDTLNDSTNLYITSKNFKPKLNQKFTSQSPIIVQSYSSSASSSSSSSSSPSPVLVKNKEEEQTERFFESNTLYKKELKQKQRDILSSTTTTTSPASLNKPVLNHSPILLINKLESDNSTNDLNRSNEKRSTLPTNHSNNKVLNLFNNLLNRSRNSDEQTSPTNLNPKQVNDGNYLSIKNLKRATSTSQFNHNSNNTSPINKSLNESTKISTSSLFNPSSIFNKSFNKTSTYSSDNNTNGNNKYRRSFDDVTRLSLLQQQQQQQQQHNQITSTDETILNLDTTKFENTAFSTKNNGLIFIPQNNIDQEREDLNELNETNYENLDTNLTIDTNSTTFSNTINNKSFNNKQIKNFEIYSPNNLKPSDDILKRINSLTSSSSSSSPSSSCSKSLKPKINDIDTNDSNAFDNIVYSYVDNIRQHSKRLSEINLLNQSHAIAAATAAAAAAVSSLEASKQPQTNNQAQSQTKSKPDDWSKTQSVNSNLNNISCSLSSSSTSSGSNSLLSSNNSFHSPKSSSSETVIINSNPNNTNVLSLRDKFEQFKQSNEDFSNKSNLKQKPISLPVINQFGKKLNDGLIINTNNSNTNKSLNSPALSSVSNSSSSSNNSTSMSSSSTSFFKELYTLNSNEVLNKQDSEKESNLNNNTNENNKNNNNTNSNKKFTFNFYYEFYRFNSSNDAECIEDEQSNEIENIKLQNDKIYSKYYKDLLNLFMNKFYPKNLFIQNVFDPLLVDSLSITYQTNCLFNYKFTIEFFKPILNNNKILIQNKSSNNLDINKLNDQNDLNLVNQNFLIDFNLNIYDMLLNDISFNLNLKSNSSNVNNEDINEFESIKNKLKKFMIFKLNFFNEEFKIVQKNVEINDKIGQKILKELENNENISTLELDKYKLLVNESDVITNLLLKLCNKIANTENSIQLMQLKQMNSNSCLDQSNHSYDTKLSNEEIDLLKQELNQIHRKKEEALFLKNGIDKRAITVSEILSKYLTKEQSDEFESFMNTKLINSLKQRHLKDHFELAQLQFKLLNDLNL